jgi:phosphate starvation-inducible protein PhoH
MRNKKKKVKPINQKNKTNQQKQIQNINIFKDFKSKLKPKTENQGELIRTIAENTITLAIGPAGSGKTKLAVAYGIEKLLIGDFKKLVITRPVVDAGESLGHLPGPQPLDAKLATPNGWVSMGEINIGDYVIGRDGFPTKVLGIYPKGKKDVYRITTSDGTTTECCIDHLWYTTTAEEKKRGKSGEVRSTKEILGTFKTNKGKINHFLPRNEPVQYEKKELPIPPYVLGVLLGDGHIGSNVSFASVDQEIADRVKFESESVGLTISELRKNENCKCYNLYYPSDCRKTHRKILLTNTDTQETNIYERIHDVSNLFGITKNCVKDRCTRKTTINKIRYEFIPLKNKWSSKIKNIMEDLNLQGKKSFEKHIPNIYKYSTVDDRLAIIRGLMDTDGCVKKNGEASFTTTSKKMAEDIIEIVRSLGGRATLRSRNRIGKKNLLKSGRYIISKRISYEFNISLPKHLNPFYITRKAKRFDCKYIFSVGISSIELVGQKEVQCIMVDNIEHLYLTDNFIVTHNTFAEKLDPYLQPIYYELMNYLSKAQLQEFINNGINFRGEKEIIIAPLAYMRGMNYHDSFMILDEAQNCTKEQMKLFITRVGFNSKAVLVGDDKQSDLPPGKSGIMYWHDTLKNIPKVGVFRLDNRDIIRNSVISDILYKIGE